MKVIKTKIVWHNAEKELPDKSGDYLCITNIKFMNICDLPYSFKNKAFNAYDYGDAKHGIRVCFWATLDELRDKFGGEE